MVDVVAHNTLIITYIDPLEEVPIAAPIPPARCTQLTANHTHTLQCKTQRADPHHRHQREPTSKPNVQHSAQNTTETAPL